MQLLSTLYSLITIFVGLPQIIEDKIYILYLIYYSTKEIERMKH